MVSPTGRVSTIAGTGQLGYVDGNDTDKITFSSPSGITVWRDWKHHDDGRLVLFVADTGNHRIRKITGQMHKESENKEKNMINVEVECFSGFCGESPQAGYSDGNKNQSRFDTPIGIAVSNNGDLYITDTNNHLIRKINSWGEATTLAGKLILAEVNREGKRLEGCPNPCLTGSQGFDDGDLQSARFSFPTGVALTSDETSLLVTNRHFLRSISIDKQKVKTIAGGNRESEQDGQGLEASFNKPNGITVTSDGFAYLVDSASCRIRRVATPRLFAPTIKCNETVGDIFRPSGCSSYNSKIDQHGFEVTSRYGNIQYNYLNRNWTDREVGDDFIGRGTKDCVGSPPLQRLDKLRWNESTLVIDDGKVYVREDPNEGSLIQIVCQAKCNSTDVVNGIKFPIDGSSKTFLHRYTAESPICIAAAHSGLINEEDSKEEILLDVMLHYPIEPNSSSYFNYSKTNGEQTQQSIPDTSQFFSLRLTSEDVVIQTISGAPAALRGKSCGYVDSIPAQEAKVCKL